MQLRCQVGAVFQVMSLDFVLGSTKGGELHEQPSLSAHLWANLGSVCLGFGSSELQAPLYSHLFVPSLVLPLFACHCCLFAHRLFAPLLARSITCWLHRLFAPSLARSIACSPHRLFAPSLAPSLRGRSPFVTREPTNTLSCQTKARLACPGIHNAQVA